MQKFLQYFDLSRLRDLDWADYVPRNLHFHDYELFILILAIVFLSFLVDFLLVRTWLGKNYRIFVAPGIILHEAAHFLLCLATGAKVTRVTVFDAEGGSVEHEKPKLPVIGQTLISIAPFFAGAIAIFFLSRWLGLKSVEISEVNLSYSGLLSFLKTLIEPINLTDWKNWLIFYLVLSIAVTMTPSKRDLRNMGFFLLFATIIFAVCTLFLHLQINWNFIPIDRLTVLLSTVTVLLILALFFSIVLFAVSKLFKH